MADGPVLQAGVGARAPCRHRRRRRSSSVSWTSSVTANGWRTGIMIAARTERTTAAPARIVMVARGDRRRAWRIIDAFAERTGLEARRSDRVAEFAPRSDDRDVQVIATLSDIDRDWRRHVDLGVVGAERMRKFG